MVGRTKHRNKDDAGRLDILSRFCIPCMIDGWPGTRGTIQHVTEGGRRAKDQHQRTYSACDYHHLGRPPGGMSMNVATAEERWGPSFEHNKRAFGERYGSEDELILIADALVRISVAASRRGEYLSDRNLCLATRQLYNEIVLGSSLV